MVFGISTSSQSLVLFWSCVHAFCCDHTWWTFRCVGIGIGGVGSATTLARSEARAATQSADARRVMNPAYDGSYACGPPGSQPGSAGPPSRMAADQSLSTEQPRTQQAAAHQHAIHIQTASPSTGYAQRQGPVCHGPLPAALPPSFGYGSSDGTTGRPSTSVPPPHAPARSPGLAYVPFAAPQHTQEVESKHTPSRAPRRPNATMIKHKRSTVLAILIAAALFARAWPASSAGQVSRARI